MIRTLFAKLFGPAGRPTRSIWPMPNGPRPASRASPTNGRAISPTTNREESIMAESTLPTPADRGRYGGVERTWCFWQTGSVDNLSEPGHARSS